MFKLVYNYEFSQPNDNELAADQICKRKSPLAKIQAISAIILQQQFSTDSCLLPTAK